MKRPVLVIILIVFALSLSLNVIIGELALQNAETEFQQSQIEKGFNRPNNLASPVDDNIQDMTDYWKEENFGPKK
jgi:hypothetical protein